MERHHREVTADLFTRQAPALSSLEIREAQRRALGHALRDASAHRPVVVTLAEACDDGHPAEGLERRAPRRSREPARAVDVKRAYRSGRDEESSGTRLTSALDVAGSHDEREHVAGAVRAGAEPCEGLGAQPGFRAIFALHDQHAAGLWRLRVGVGAKSQRIRATRRRL